MEEVAMKVGVVVWTEGTTVKFRIRDRVLVERGQLLKVDVDYAKFILRVFDFKPESLLTQAEIARLSKKKEAGEDVEIYDKGLRLYDTALATIICQIDIEGNVHGPTTVPPLFSEVETLNKNDLEQLRLDTGDLPIGYIRVGHKVSEAVVALDGAKTIPHHILVCGVTGAGKSNLGKVLAYSIMRTKGKYSLVLFDCESEYFQGASPTQLGLVHAPESEEYLLYVTPRVQEPCKLKVTITYKGAEVERRVEAYPLVIGYDQLRPEDFTLTGEFTHPQEELLWLVYKLRKRDWLNFLLEAPPDTIYRFVRKLAAKNTINTLKRKIKHLLGSGDVFLEDAPDFNTFDAIVGAVMRGCVVLIDIPYATEGEEKLLATAVARRIFDTYEKLRKHAPEDWEKLPYALVAVEEAHRYLSKTSLTSTGELKENIFSIISKRGRKYRVGALYITQMPGELIEPVIRQSLTKIILPLPTKPDYTKVIEYSPYLDEASQEIKTLDRGEALVISPPSGIRFAVPIKVFSYEEIVGKRLSEEISVKYTPARKIKRFKPLKKIKEEAVVLS
ncbi:MAG: hypothetical protein DRJ52_07500 [Thermoprotei archaeon]|nr:MAG: hypothetical protein DRJ52_07500 [Thermoprotei archaeon]RLE98575.1 MAG: hypothetical protein DRJ63_07505 [Thermoprotei archaeon]